MRTTAKMARRGEEFARLEPGGGYTQALAVGKGFSGSERSTIKEGGPRRGSGLPSSSSAGTMSAYARHKMLISNYHRCGLMQLYNRSGFALGVGYYSSTHAHFACHFLLVGRVDLTLEHFLLDQCGVFTIIQTGKLTTTSTSIPPLFMEITKIEARTYTISPKKCTMGNQLSEPTSSTTTVFSLVNNFPG